jgi:hypothetical protein
MNAFFVTLPPLKCNPIARAGMALANMGHRHMEKEMEYASVWSPG